MTKIETKSVHVMVMPEDAFSSKKTLLEIQLHLLSTLKHMLSYQDYKVEELRLKRESRAKMQDLVREIRNIIPMLPISQAISEMKEFKLGLTEIKTIIEKPRTKRDKIEAELDFIKRKLESLQ